MRERKPEHPNPVRDLSSIHDTGSGKKMRSDAKGERAGFGNVRNQSRVPLSLRSLKKKQKRDPWCNHQSVAFETQGKCHFAGCPNLHLSDAKRKRGYGTYMRCVQCSAEKGKHIYFCNDTKNGKPVLCHWRYHTKHHCEEVNA